MEKNAEIISTQVERITKIISQVLDYSRKHGPTRRAVELQTVVATPWNSSARSPGGTASTSTWATRRRRPVPGDADEIQQVCMNLIMNAIQAMPNGGTLGITIDTSCAARRGSTCRRPRTTR